MPPYPHAPRFSQAFVASRLRDQMDDQVRSWMNNPTKGFSADPKSTEVKMSRIFLWFADDFGGLGRPSLKYALPFVPDGPAEEATKGRLGAEGLASLRVRYVRASNPLGADADAPSHIPCFA